MSLAALALLTYTLVADSNVEVRAPVNVAYQLYTSCVSGYLTSTNIEPNRKAIKEFITAVDEQCIKWTIIWYQPIMGKSGLGGIHEWDSASQERLSTRRKDYLEGLENFLRVTLKVK